jgi:hypothetical protein
MIQLVIKPSRIILSENSYPDIKVTTFEEEFELYKRKCKKKQWATPEGFSLEFDSSLSDLKKCIFVYTNSKNTINKIRRKFNVIEENEIHN